MKYKVSPSEITGFVKVSPSKSHTLRAILFALMAEGDSVIRNYLGSPDTISMIEAIRQFGAQVHIEDDALYITGVGGKLKRPTDVIDAGNSGLVFRLIGGIAALSDSYVVITGDESIRTRRPIKPLLDALTSQNIFAESMGSGGHAPIIIKGPLKPGCFSLNGKDSQPVSSLLIATAFMKSCSEIYVLDPGERPWIDMTINWLSKFGVQVINADYRYYWISGGASIDGFEMTIPGDFSTAAYLIAAALVTKQEITVAGLDMNDVQGDKTLIDILQKMGVSIRSDEENQLVIINGAHPFHGLEIDINDCVDALPILAVIACFATSPTVITGAEVCRLKESDRIAAITSELKKMGAEIEETPDGVIVNPCRLKGGNLFSYKDHRIALSLIIAGLGSEGFTEIDGVEYIAKTYPTFLCDFISLGGKIE